MSGGGGGPGTGLGGALRDTIRMEARRVASVRVTYVLVGLAFVTGGVIALLIGLVAPPGTGLASPRTTAALTAGGDSLPLSVVGGFVALLGVVSVGHDYRFGLLPAVLVAQPRRGLVLVGRAVVLAAVAGTCALGVSLIGVAVCWMVGRPPAHDAVTLRVVATHAAVAVVWAWLGAGLTWVLRSTAGAVSVLLLGPLLVEPLLSLLGGGGTGGSDVDALLRWLPFAAARQALGRQVLADADSIGALAGGGVFALFTLAVLALGCALVSRRDA